VNDYRWRAFGADPDRVIAFVCECGDTSCARTVQLTSRAYTAQRDGLVLHDVHAATAGGPEPVLSEA
jgi:hypothetical protein